MSENSKNDAVTWGKWNKCSAIASETDLSADEYEGLLLAVPANFPLCSDNIMGKKHGYGPQKGLGR